MSLLTFSARTDYHSIQTFQPKSITINGYQFGFFSYIEITQSFENNTGKDLEEAVYILPKRNMLCLSGITFFIGEVKVDSILKKTKYTKETTGETKKIEQNVTYFYISHIPKDQTIKVILNVSLMSQLFTSNTIITKIPLSESDKSLIVNYNITEFSQIQRVDVNCDDYYFDSKQNKLTLQAATFTQSNFIIKIQLSEKVQSQMVKCEKVTALSIIPDFLSKAKLDKNKEFIFLIDCSESMIGDSFSKAKEALDFFISHVPTNSLFNVIKFGETYNKMFAEPVHASDKNKNKVKNEISQIRPNMVTTEMVQLFEELFESNPLKLRDIFIITDGVVSKREEIVKLIQNNKEFNRIFAFGLGEGKDEGFLDEIAEITNGKSCFVYESEDIEKVAAEFFDLSLAPVATDTEIHIEGEKDIQISPSTFPPLLPNTVHHFFIRASSESAEEMANISIRSKIENQSNCYEESVDLVMNLPSELRSKNPILALFAHKKLRSIDEIGEEEAIQLSLESGVMCKYTDYKDDMPDALQQNINNILFKIESINRNFKESDELMMRNIREASMRSGPFEAAFHDSPNDGGNEANSERPTLMQKFSGFSSYLRFWDKH